MEDYSRPHNGPAVVGVYDQDKLDAGLGSMVEGFERAADQIKGQQVMVFPHGEGVGEGAVQIDRLPSTGLTFGPVRVDSIDKLVDAVRALVNHDEELTVDILLGIEADDVQALGFFVNKLGAMLVARASVDEITAMIEAKQKKEKAEPEKK